MESHFSSNNSTSSGDRYTFDKDDEYDSAKIYFLNIVNSIIVAEGDLLPMSLRTRNLEADFDELWSNYITMRKKKNSVHGMSSEVDQNKENGKISNILLLSSLSLTQPNNNSATESVLRKPFNCNNNNNTK